MRDLRGMQMFSFEMRRNTNSFFFFAKIFDENPPFPDIGVLRDEVSHCGASIK